MFMAGLSYLKKLHDSAVFRGNAGNFTAGLGISCRLSGFWSARAFSSVNNVETLNGQNQDQLKLDPFRILFHRYGFTLEQVIKVTMSFKLVLSINMENLSAQLAFLRSIIGSDDDVPKIVAANPRLLHCSLNNRLMPNYKFIKSIIDRDELVAKCIKRFPIILCLDLEENLAAKVSLLKEYGVPCASIAKLMEYSPFTLSMSVSKLEVLLKKALGFRFEPSSPMIVSALKAIGQISESNWDRKVEIYRKWGWSNDALHLAFRKQPSIMCLSEKKINKGMDMFLNTVGLSFSDIVKNPSILFLSVEERIFPRCSVLALLHFKGVLGDISPSSYVVAFKATEKAFVERFIDKYPEHVLELWLKLRQKACLALTRENMKIVPCENL